MDISESARQIGEKLFALLDTEQQKDLLQYILNRENLSDFPIFSYVLFLNVTVSRMVQFNHYWKSGKVICIFVWKKERCVSAVRR